MYIVLIIEATNSGFGRTLMAMKLFGLLIEVLIEVIIEDLVKKKPLYFNYSGIRLAEGDGLNILGSWRMITI